MIYFPFALKMDSNTLPVFNCFRNHNSDHDLAQFFVHLSIKLFFTESNQAARVTTTKMSNELALFRKFSNDEWS